MDFFYILGGWLTWISVLVIVVLALVWGGIFLGSTILGTADLIRRIRSTPRLPLALTLSALVVLICVAAPYLLTTYWLPPR